MYYGIRIPVADASVSRCCLHICIWVKMLLLAVVTGWEYQRPPILFRVPVTHRNKILIILEDVWYLRLRFNFQIHDRIFAKQLRYIALCIKPAAKISWYSCQCPMPCTKQQLQQQLAHMAEKVMSWQTTNLCQVLTVAALCYGFFIL